MHPDYANFIALVAAGAINFLLQKTAFAGKRPLQNTTLEKYAITTAIAIAVSQVCHAYFMNHKKRYVEKLPTELQPYYTTVARTIAASLVFVCVSFPLRKLWVFA